MNLYIHKYQKDLNEFCKQFVYHFISTTTTYICTSQKIENENPVIKFHLQNRNPKSNHKIQIENRRFEKLNSKMDLTIQNENAIMQIRNKEIKTKKEQENLKRKRSNLFGVKLKNIGFALDVAQFIVSRRIGFHIRRGV